MSNCYDTHEVLQDIEDCRKGKMSEEALVLKVLSAMYYECDSPKLHDNCYEARCRVWAKELYDFLKREKKFK